MEQLEGDCLSLVRERKDLVRELEECTEHHQAELQYIETERDHFYQEVEWLQNELERQQHDHEVRLYTCMSIRFSYLFLLPPFKRFVINW